MWGGTSNFVAGYQSPVKFITANSVFNGTIIATPNEGIVTGSLIGIETTPAAGYKLVTGSLRAYKTGDESIEVPINENIHGNKYFAMPAYDVTVTAAFDMATGFAVGNMQMLQLYPNPTKDKVYIKGLTTPTWVEVYSMTGEKVIVKTVEVNHALSLNSLPNGMYLLRIKGQNYKLLLNK